MKMIVTPKSLRTRKKIIETGLKMALKIGVTNLTAGNISKKMKCREYLVIYQFVSTKILVEEIIKCAINREIWEIVAQAIILRHPVAEALSKKIKRKALLSFIK